MKKAAYLFIAIAPCE